MATPPQVNVTPNTNYVYRIVNKKIDRAQKYETEFAELGTKPTYPSEYFENAGNKVNFNYFSWNDNIDEDYQFVELGKKQIMGTGMALTKNVGLALIGLAIRTIKATNDKVWKSFGQFELGAGEVTPSKICHLKKVKFEESEIQNEFEKKPEHETDLKWVLGVYVGAYRFACIPDKASDTYERLVAKRIISVLLGLGGDYLSGKDADLINAYKKAKGWKSDPEFVKGCAILDMFLSKFKSLPISPIRVGTLGTRYKDCVSITSFKFMAKILKLTCGELAMWILRPEVAEDFVRMFKGDEEIDKEDSYFPYMTSLGLCQSSKYSGTANPCIQMFICTIGCCKKEQRFMRASYLAEGSLNYSLDNALWVAWVFEKGSVEGPQFAGSALTDEQLDTLTRAVDLLKTAQEEVHITEEDEKKILHSLQGMDYLPALTAIYTKFGGVVPDYVKSHYFHIFKDFEKLEDRNTVGNHLRDLAIAWIREKTHTMNNQTLDQIQE